MTKELDIVGILDNVKKANILQTNVSKEVIDLNDETDSPDAPKL